MRILSIFLILILFSCSEKGQQLDNIAIAQWDLRTKFDSVLNVAETFYFPKLFLIKNNKFYTYRSVDRYKNFDYQSHLYEYGECLDPIPKELISQIKYINPEKFDTIYPTRTDILYHDLHYSVADPKTNRYCLFVPSDINDTALQVINQLLKYSDTTRISKSTDTADLNLIRESIKKMAIRHSVPQSSVKLTPAAVE